MWGSPVLRFWGTLGVTKRTDSHVMDCLEIWYRHLCSLQNKLQQLWWCPDFSFLPSSGQKFVSYFSFMPAVWVSLVGIVRWGTLRFQWLQIIRGDTVKSKTSFHFHCFILAKEVDLLVLQNWFKIHLQLLSEQQVRKSAKTFMHTWINFEIEMKECWSNYDFKRELEG